VLTSFDPFAAVPSNLNPRCSGVKPTQSKISAYFLHLVVTQPTPFLKKQASHLFTIRRIPLILALSEFQGHQSAAW